MRDFDPHAHIRCIDKMPEARVRDGRGDWLEGVVGRSGVRADGHHGAPIGLDQIEMQPGTRFDMHDHAGDHILYVLEGDGGITINGITHHLSAGDSVFVPAEYPHGVTTIEGAVKPFRFLAFGVPHKPLDDDHRMRLIES
jgi:quercetin dioxygenase-like cupin family protein